MVVQDCIDLLSATALAFTHYKGCHEIQILCDKNVLNYRENTSTTQLYASNVIHPRGQNLLLSLFVGFLPVLMFLYLDASPTSRLHNTDNHCPFNKKVEKLVGLVASGVLYTSGSQAINILSLRLALHF